MATDILEVKDMLGDSFEPKRQFRWIIVIDGIDGFTAKSSSRPQITFGETVIDYINQKRFLAGKGTWAPINLTLYDPIVPSASVKVMEWVRLAWENVTGRMGYAAMYKKEITLKMLDSIGACVEQWTLQGAWVQDANAGTLDYSVDDPCQLELVIRFDQAILEF